jgi:hypothetical protein
MLKNGGGELKSENDKHKFHTCKVPLAGSEPEDPPLAFDSLTISIAFCMLAETKEKMVIALVMH